MTSDGDRDASLERLLRQSLHAREQAVSSGACLDAETLAAWADGTLTGDASAAAEAHAADCSRCLALLSAMAQTTPAASSESWWTRLGAARWLVPLTAAATAVAIWIAVPAPPFVETGPPSRPGPAALGALQQPVAPPADEVRAPAETAAQPRARAAAPAPAQAEADAATVEAPAREQVAGRLNAAAEVPGARADAAPPPAAAAPPQTLEPAARALARDERIGPRIVSADPAVGWRFGAAGFVERSIDSGASWEALSIGVNAVLAAGAAPSASVCWVVGQAGTVLVTTDARDWQRLTFPEPIDLVAVRATDARTAMVATADGRAFATEDGGRTWTLRPLQEF